MHPRKQNKYIWQNRRIIYIYIPNKKTRGRKHTFFFMAFRLEMMELASQPPYSNDKRGLTLREENFQRWTLAGPMLEVGQAALTTGQLANSPSFNYR